MGVPPHVMLFARLSKACLELVLHFPLFVPLRRPSRHVPQGKPQVPSRRRSHTPKRLDPSGLPPVRATTVGTTSTSRESGGRQ